MKHFLIGDPQFSSHVPKGGGIYRLHCLADDTGTGVVPVPRALDVDQAGILYIGKASTYVDRVINLKKTISPKYRGQSHICGRRYKNPIYESFGKRFPFDRLCISFEPSPTPEATEKEALEAYARRFGELPPLNRQG